MRLLDRFRGCGCRQRVGPRQKTTQQLRQVKTLRPQPPSTRHAEEVAFEIGDVTQNHAVKNIYKVRRLDGVPCMANRRASARMSCDVEVSQLTQRRPSIH
jgi:hypothetical protein